MNTERFDASLPAPYSTEWRKAERDSITGEARYTSYQAPGGKPIVFFYDKFNLKGGQSIDTAEYPFNGLWSNKPLNEKPQRYTLKGFVRGEEYIKTRNELVEALRITSSDDAPAYIDLPFWGRLPVVADDYEISEDKDSKGQCEVSLTFTRAGISEEKRTSDIDGAALNAAVKKTFKAALAAFLKKISGVLSVTKLLSVFGKIKSALMQVVGRIQAAQSAINTISNEINSISSLISQGITAPLQLARAAVNAVNSIVAGAMEVKNSVTQYADAADDFSITLPGEETETSVGGSGTSTSTGSTSADDAASVSSYPEPEVNNDKNVITQFLSASTFTDDSAAVTAAEIATKSAAENFYKTIALCGAAQVIVSMDASYQSMQGYLNAYTKLEESIDSEDPEVYTALSEMRVAVTNELRQKSLSAEITKSFRQPLPLLAISQLLSCDTAKLRALNNIEDSFVVEGDIVYV